MLRNDWYDDHRCSECGSVMLDGRCENRACSFHWHPLSPDDLIEDEYCYQQPGA